MSKVASIALMLGAAVVGFASGAQAATITCGLPGGGSCVGSITSTIGTPVPQETQIFLTAATGTTFVGNVGANNGPSLVTFTANQTVSAANGSATINETSPNSPFFSLLVSVASGFRFTDLSFSTLGNENLSVTGSNAGLFTINDLGAGLNQFVVAALNGSFFTSLLLSSTDGFKQIKDIQISGLIGPVPLPGALVLFGSGLVGLGLLARRRRKSFAPAI